jgi:hypothetical protein
VSINDPPESVAESTADGNGVNKRQSRRVASDRIESPHYQLIIVSRATASAVRNRLACKLVKVLQTIFSEQLAPLLGGD